jgi:hypothetical protein
MRIAKGHIVPLGYGKYFRADSIVGVEPLEGRGIALHCPRSRPLGLSTMAMS